MRIRVLTFLSWPGSSWDRSALPAAVCLQREPGEGARLSWVLPALLLQALRVGPGGELLFLCSLEQLLLSTQR